MQAIPLLALRVCFLLSLFFVLNLNAWAADPGIGRSFGEARRSLASDQKPGSVLVFNIYTSDTVGSAKTDTDLSITNLNASQTANVHLFFIANSCAVADTFICLTPNQTASFFASDVDPGITGYIIGIATDAQGCPISFNHLIGGEYVKFASGHTASLSAESYSALYTGTLPGCAATTPMATINLDGVQYNAAPTMLAVDKIRSAVDGNSTMLALNSLNGNLAIGMRLIGEFTGALFDDTENGKPFRATGACQFRATLADDFPRINVIDKFTTIIPRGRTGWMWLAATEGRAFSGAAINFHPEAATKKGAFTGGHNLHHLRFGTASLIVPVFPPSC